MSGCGKAPNTRDKLYASPQNVSAIDRWKTYQSTHYRYYDSSKLCPFTYGFSIYSWKKTFNIRTVMQLITTVNSGKANG
jgi:hypothetical protein